MCACKKNAANAEYINEKKMNLTSSSNFCKTENFNTYCQELEINIEKYISQHKLEMIRKKSFFEKTWFYPFLLILTGIIIVFIIILINKGDGFPISLIGSTIMERCAQQISSE